MKLHDGQVIQLPNGHLAEFIHNPATEDMPERKALRIANQYGFGVCIEGEDAFDMLILAAQWAINT